MVVLTLLAFCVTFPAKPKEERKALYLSVLSSDIILVELTMSLEGSEEKSRHLLEVSRLVFLPAAVHFISLPHPTACEAVNQRGRTSQALLSDGPIASNYQFMSRIPTSTLHVWTQAKNSSSVSKLSSFGPNQMAH